MAVLGRNCGVDLVACVDSGPFALRHELQGHPLLQLDELAECASELVSLAGKFSSPDWPVENHLGNLPRVLPGGRPPRLGNGIDIADMIRGIDRNGCWVVLWNIEQIPRYAHLIDGYLAVVRPQATPADPQVFREGFVFISAPNSVTPVHIDPEHNSLLQIRGLKSVAVGAIRDRELWHREIERVILGGDRHLPIAPDSEQQFELAPGCGVYIPPFAPHWVRNGSDVCVSLSVTWRTHSAFRRERVHYANGRLRRLGLRPQPPGYSKLGDQSKIAALTIADAFRRACFGFAGGRRYDPRAHS